MTESIIEGATITVKGESGGIVRSLIVGPDRESVIYRGQLYRVGWGWGYDPIVSEPRQRPDGQWEAEASRAASCD